MRNFIGLQTTPRHDGIGCQQETKLTIEGNSGHPVTNDPGGGQTQDPLLSVSTVKIQLVQLRFESLLHLGSI
jgi:hypothetical protein